MSDRRGFVLIAVLWLLVALGAVGLHAALELRSERRAAANVLDEHRARQVALAGTEYARSRLSSAMLDRAEELRSEVRESRSRRRRNRNRTLSVERLFQRSDPVDDPWRNPEELVMPEMSFGDARFVLRVRDTGAALHLNTADEEMLRRFFAQGMELDYALADRLAQAIMDWRDEDLIPRVGGGEAEEYLAAGAAVLPPNRPFASLDELRHVMGMTPEIYAAALPYLTLVGTGRINVNAAPAPVLMSIPGMTPEAVAEIMNLREAGVFPRGRSDLIDMLPAGAGRALEEEIVELPFRAGFRTNEVEITAEGGVEGSAVQSRVRAVVTRTDEGAMLVWREVDG